MDWECAFYPNLQQFPGERQMFPALSRWAPRPARSRRSLQAGSHPHALPAPHRLHRTSFLLSFKNCLF